MNSIEVRSEIVDRLRRDLVGPSEHLTDDDLANEQLKENPSRWYLTGFLAPAYEGTIVDTDSDEEEEELLALEAGGAGAGGAAGDDDEPEPPAARRRFLPSSIGITVMLPVGVKKFTVRTTWGDYVTEPQLPPEVLEGEKRDNTQKVVWVRKPGLSEIEIDVPPPGKLAKRVLVDSAAPGKRGGALELGIQAREFTLNQPDGTVEKVNVITVFLVNRRVVVRGRYADITYVFQARLALMCDSGFHPQFDLSRYRSNDDDDRLADLHYRDLPAYAVGRNAATSFRADPDGVVRFVATDAMPRAAVERVVAAKVDGVEFGIEALADLAAKGGSELAERLTPLVEAYASWSGTQTAEAKSDPSIAGAKRRVEIAENLIKAQARARARIAEGVALLQNDDRSRQAFAIMNRAIAMAARQRNAAAEDVKPEDVAAPTWRPFQLAFILLNLAGSASKTHPDREVVDLLFFPTGGGKTEAYLGLAGFAIAHRRLSAGGVIGAGVSVIMRYTLRLLTLDQLGRAAGLICALELLRTGQDYRTGDGRPLLGDWPIEIGLWVGSDASPNSLGGKNNKSDNTAVKRVRDYKLGKDKRAPAPIKACPWCATPFTTKSFACVPSDLAPTNLEIRCANVDCAFTGDRALPIVTVDEAIYRRLPAFMVATVDKFAALPWKGEAGAFFGHVERHDHHGFYGADEPHSGKPISNGHRLDPPDLIIQDELHLISGPLGTVAGLYEAAIDRLASREVLGHVIRPKIVASTATVRRASHQIKALFDRSDTQVFPAPGINRRNSFFAATVPESESPARWYLGLAASGRGPKLVFLRGLTTLLAAAQAMEITDGEAADPYLTALCYFNALRELGGARRIVEDEIRAGTSQYGTERRRLEPNDQPFANRKIGEPLELTSRVSTDAVAEAKSRLEKVFTKSAETVDVALATNMISVGLDITRLGLMVVQGQPKTASEYIQATSRVGRDHQRPGLVVTVLNLHKPRDRMHFEQFCHFHSTFYRAVEATSVTPWAARALDRALAAVVVTLARHLRPELTPSRAVVELESRPDVRAEVIRHLVARAPDDIVGGKSALEALIAGLLDDWIEIAREQTEGGGKFFYDKTGPQHLLHAPLDKEIPNLDPRWQRFQAGWSMRDVEPAVRMKPRAPDGNLISNADDLA